MISHFVTITRNTYLEARHNKVLHIASGFAAVIILFSLFMGEISLYSSQKVVKDIGLSAISLLGVFVAIFLGASTLYNELERRTIYSIIAKPVSRREILLGKFFGLCFVLLIVLLMMTIYLYLVTAFLESSIDFYLMPAIVLIYAELVIVAALAVFFSSFTTPFLSAIFTSGAFIIGRISNELGQFGERSKNPVFKFFATGIQKVYDLEAFNLRSHVVHRLPIYMEDVWYPIAYAVFFSGILIMISMWVFRRRDFK